jgi:nitrite reductase/ring-hydroxylating ferredoxin subunit
MARRKRGDAQEGSLSRREALALAAAPALALAACAPAPPVPRPVEVPLANLPEGVRVVVRRGEEPVELLRSGAAVRALSLWCPHLGCEVRWDAASERYVCPCHAGIFDAEGRVIQGLPAAPLARVTVAVDGQRVILPPPAGARPAATG